MLNSFQRMMMGLPGNPFNLQDEQNTPQPPASGGSDGASAGGSVLPAVAAPMLNEDQQTVALDKMGQLGVLLMAAGQRMTPQMRGQILAQGANFMGDTHKDLLNAAQARLMGAKAQEAQQDATRRAEFENQIKADPSILQKLNISPMQYKLMGMDAVTKALEAQMSRDPADVAYKNAMVKKLQEGNINDFQVIGEDEFGNKKYGIPSQIMQNGGLPNQPNTTDIFSQLGNSTGQEALDKLKQVNPAIASEVASIVNGDQPFPTRVFGTKRGAVLNSLVSMVDPTYNAGTYKQRQTTIADFNKNGGPNTAGGQAAFGETGIKHMGEIYDLADNLPNHTNFGPLNSTVNSLDATLKGKSGEGGKINSYKIAVINGMDEIAKALGIGGEGGRAELQHQLEAAQGPAAIKQVVRQQAKLLKEKLDTLQGRWNNEMGPAAGNRQVISPDARLILNHLLSDEPGKGSVHYDNKGNRLQ